MNEMEVAPPQSTILAQSAIEEFMGALHGEVLAPGAAGYDAARTVWNAMIDKRPALIVRCVDAEDVVCAVNFARTHNLLLAVRGGGHNVAGKAVCDEGLMIDLSLMKAVHVDPVQCTARVEPGVLWGELDQATQAYGLATTGGTISHTGVAGLTLGGGEGWLLATHGLACDNLLSAEVVLANGQHIQASSTENPDLFWAFRGGGGNFGIVTNFEFRLHAVGPTVLGGMVIHPISQAREVLRFYRDAAANSPDELTLFAALLTTPEGLPVVAIIMGWFGDLDQGEKVLAPIRQFGTPLADLVGPLLYCQLQTLLDGAAPHGWSRYWKSGYITELRDELIDLIVIHATAKPSPLSVIPLFHIHGAATRVEPDSTAFAMRRIQWDLNILAQWTEPADANANIQWARAFWDAVAPFSAGVYVNHLDVDDGAARVRAAYGANYARLVELKRKYDPDNFFRLNHNIDPL